MLSVYPPQRRPTGEAGDSFIEGRVEFFSNLPNPNEHPNEIFLVEKSSGFYFINRKNAGLYFSNGFSWEPLPQNFEAEIIRYDNETSGLLAENVQDALDELSNKMTFTLPPIDDNRYIMRNAEWEILDIPDAPVEIEAVNGGVFPVNITGVGGNNVNILTTSLGGALTSVQVDGDSYNLHIMAITGHTDIKPIITVKYKDYEDLFIEDISHSTSNLTASATERTVFDGTILLNIPPEAHKIHLSHPDGATFEVSIEREAPPEILTARFTGSYPSGQTELKAGDTFSFQITTDSPVNFIEFDNHGAFIAQTFNVSPGTDIHLSNVIIANRGDTATNRGARVRVRKESGSVSEWFELNNLSGQNGKDYVVLNNIRPTISFGAITYPTGQQALKNSETATVSNSVSNFSSVTYSSPNGQLNITSPNVYQSTKNVNRINGDYNISSNNLRIVATRASNGSSTTANTVVNIAHVLPTVTVTLPHARLRSGGNDETNVPSYNINITSNQQMLTAPSIGSASKGTLGGSTGSQNISIHDNLEKGVGTFSEFYGVNLAGLEVTNFTAGNNVSGGTAGSLNYTVGGFISRTLTLPPFSNTVNFNSSVDTLGKLAFSWSFKSAMNSNASATGTNPPLNGGWTINSLNINPTTLIILDTQATNSSSQNSFVTIQEVV